MQEPCKGQTAMDAKKGKYMVREQDPAYHKTEHIGKQQDIYDKHKEAGRTVFSPKQVLMPAEVQQMMDRE